MADSSLDLGDLPDKYFTVRCASHCLLGAGQEDCLGVGLILLLLSLFADRRSIVLESFRLVGPLHEKNAVFAVTGELVRVHRVEFDPVRGAEIRLVVEFHRDYRSVLILVRPVPQRARLGLISAKRRDVAVICRKVHHHDTAGVWFEEGAHRGARVRVPHDKHAVIAGIGSHEPGFVLTAQDRSDLVTMTLQQLLLLRHIVVNDASVRGRIENLGPFFASQEMHTLVDVFVETVDFVERL